MTRLEYDRVVHCRSALRRRQPVRHVYCPSSVCAGVLVIVASGVTTTTTTTTIVVAVAAVVIIEISVLVAVVEAVAVSIAVAVALIGDIPRKAVSPTQVHHHRVRVRCHRSGDGRRHWTRWETALRSRGLHVTMPFMMRATECSRGCIYMEEESTMRDNANRHVCPVHP